MHYIAPIIANKNNIPARADDAAKKKVEAIAMSNQ